MVLTKGFCKHKQTKTMNLKITMFPLKKVGHPSSIPWLFSSYFQAYGASNNWTQRDGKRVSKLKKNKLQKICTNEREIVMWGRGWWGRHYANTHTQIITLCWNERKRGTSWKHNFPCRIGKIHHKQMKDIYNRVELALEKMREAKLHAKPLSTSRAWFFVRCTILDFTWSTFTFVNYECYSIATFYVFIANKAFFHYSVSMLEDGKNPNGIATLLLLLLLFLIHQRGWKPKTQ